MRQAYTPTPDSAAASPLGELLDRFGVRDAVQKNCELQRPWRLKFSRGTGAHIYAVLQGDARITVEDGSGITLNAGQIALLPSGLAYTIEGGDGHLDDLPSAGIDALGGRTIHALTSQIGPATAMATLSIAFTQADLLPMPDLMPSLIPLHTDGPTSYLMDLAAMEGYRAGAPAMIARISELILARHVRAWAERGEDGRVGWLAAYSDPHIGKALIGLHKHPERSWTIAALARLAGLSRATFAQRFHEILGMPPIRYLTQWRMSLARHMLREHHLTIAQISARLGYESEFAFSRAFKRITGHAPSEYRSSIGQPAPSATTIRVAPDTLRLSRHGRYSAES